MWGENSRFVLLSKFLTGKKRAQKVCFFTVRLYRTSLADKDNPLRNHPQCDTSLFQRKAHHIFSPSLQSKMLRRALLVTPRAFYVTLQNPLNMQKAARFMQRAAFSFMRFLRRFRLRIVDHLHLSIGEIERFHVLHLFDLCVNHRFKRRRVEPDSVLAENLLRIRQLLVAIACAV